MLSIYKFGGMEYKISEDGIIYGLKGEIKQRKNKDGYMIVTIGSGKQRTSKLVHRLVAETYIPNENNLLEVNHKDYNRVNNSLENLEWISHKENVRYSSEIGKYKNNTTGTRNGRARYSKDEVKKIRELYDNGLSVMDIIKELFPKLEYEQRKNKWSRVKEICIRKTYCDI